VKEVIQAQFTSLLIKMVSLILLANNMLPKIQQILIVLQYKIVILVKVPHQLLELLEIVLQFQNILIIMLVSMVQYLELMI